MKLRVMTHRVHRFSSIRFSVLILAAFLAVTGNVTAELSDDLVGYWPFEDDLHDWAGNNHGTFRGSNPHTNFQEGMLGQGIVLDGIDQHIEIANESNFDFIDQDFSISAWFQVNEFSKNWQALIAKGEGNRWRVHRRGGESIMTWNGGNADVPADANFPIDDGEIHHFVGVSIAGEEVRMYMDGELVSVGAAPTVENNDMPVLIGDNPDAPGRSWNGLVDEVAIWGRAIEEDEVAYLYNDGIGNWIFPPPPPRCRCVAGADEIGTEVLKGTPSNQLYGPGQNVTGWSGRIVTFEGSGGVTISDHNIALDVLDESEGQRAEGAYAVVDMAGGGGTFDEDLPYPNGVNDASMSDFAVEVKADVKIPAGTWTIGFGSDDGGRILIPDVQFDDSSDNNDALDTNELRFTGNRGHGWTVGSFTLEEDLETSITASFHERGGGDSFEIAIINGKSIEDANPANGWALLGDGTFGWEVETTAAPLIAADLTAEFASSRPVEFDVNGDTGESDQLTIENPDFEVYTTILNLGENLTIQINAIGNVESGDSFPIFDVGEVQGMPTIISRNANETWVYLDGRVCLDVCIHDDFWGDYNLDGLRDTVDIDLQAQAMNDPNPDLATFDENIDGVVDIFDRLIWVEHYKATWVGDADLNGFFESGDLVAVFTAGKYENGEAAGWAEGDWDGDLLFGTGDLVTAFTDGGYEAGPRLALAVPEPTSIATVLIGMLGLLRLGGRRT